MDMIRKLRVRFVSIMMLIICTMLIIIFGLVVHMTHSRIREDGFRMMENAVYAPMGTLSDRNPKRKDENKNMNILLPFFRVLIDADGKIRPPKRPRRLLVKTPLQTVPAELKFTRRTDRRRPHLRPRMARSSSSWISPPRS